MVGDETSFSILGTANCGKGEPNQTIFVGHATPPCLFREIDICLTLPGCRIFALFNLTKFDSSASKLIIRNSSFFICLNNSAAILKTINNGIYISNLWYLNFSDRNNGRMTGLTRFGCFLVQDGELTAPINTMRFDDSVYSMLGENLIGLTSKRELLIDSGTYEERSTSSARLPGAIVNKFKMTL